MTDRPAQTARSPELELIERAWAALRAGELDVLEGAFAPDARWRGVDDGAWACENRRQILSVMSRADAAAPTAAVEQAIQFGDRVLVAFRPDRPPPEGRPLEDGIAWVVVTVRGGEIVELKGCADKAHALAYAGAS